MIAFPEKDLGMKLETRLTIIGKIHTLRHAERIAQNTDDAIQVGRHLRFTASQRRNPGLDQALLKRSQIITPQAR